MGNLIYDHIFNQAKFRIYPHLWLAKNILLKMNSPFVVPSLGLLVLSLNQFVYPLTKYLFNQCYITGLALVYI